MRAGKTGTPEGPARRVSFSELLGGPQKGRANKVCPMIHGLRPASATTFVFAKKPSMAAERSRLACHRMNSSWSITPAACAS